MYKKQKGYDTTVYMFSWSTRQFYKQDPNGNIKMMKRAPTPKSFATQVIQNAPNWIQKNEGFQMPAREISVRRR